MRVANLEGRAVLVEDGRALDINRESKGRFPADPVQLFDRWEELLDWHREITSSDGEVLWQSAVPFEPEQLGAPSPRPRQVFAIASNYRGRASVVTGSEELPVIFTKFPSSIVGPNGVLPLPSREVDWEVELVVVIGKIGSKVSTEEAWDLVAGLTLGQDFSERTLQLGGPAKQFSLGKSFPNFGPTGPVLVTPEEFEDRENIALACTVNDETVQSETTSQLIFSVAELISRISAICELYPGDLIFTGTPAGMGMTMDPPRYLQVGDVVESFAPEIGEMRTTCIAG